jgi:hypothetical protein
MLTLSRTVAPPGIIRELARNLEKIMAGPTEEVCLATRGGRHSCSCYRDAQHSGSHRCLCGTDWPRR